MGQRLGAYEVQALIGAGGMGDVYRAHDRRLGRDVALKVLPAAWSADRDRLRRFANEARAAAALNHPHICTIYDVGAGETGEAPFIAMELLEGETLQERLTRGPLTITAGDRLTASISRMPWTPRTPSTSSIAISSRPTSSSGATAPRSWISVSRRPRLGDADIQETRSTSADGAGRYGRNRRVHVARAIARRDARWTKRCVLARAGAVRDGHRPSRVHRRHGVGHFRGAFCTRSRSRRASSAPSSRPGLEEVILKAIEKDRELRYQTAAELRADLKRLQRGMSTHSSRRAGHASSDASRRPVPWRSIASVAVVVVLLAGFAVWSGRTRRPDPPP